MNMTRKLWRMAAACGFIAVTATACYQNIDENANPAALSMGLPTATFPPFPTPTDLPPTEVVSDPQPTEGVVEEALTEDPLAEGLPTDQPFDFVPFETATLDQPFGFLPMETATPEFVVDPLATMETTTPEFLFDPFATEEEVPLLDFDTLQLTFNAPPPQDVLLGDVGGPFLTPTPTPTPIVVAQGDNFSLTATQFVLNATQTQEVSLTLTAVALGIGEEPTFPPFATDAPDIFFSTPTPTPFDTGRPAVCIHIVQPGENLFRLSMRYGVSVNDLAVANGISNIQLIRVNQQITIPGCGTTGVFPPPTPLPPGVGGPDGTVTGQNVAICNQHLVQQYETLFQISLRYGVPIQSIANANNITNINMITMATTLQIPCQ